MDDSYKLGCWGSSNEEIMKLQYPLHRACRDGDMETLSLLLMEAQHGVYVEDSFYGWTPAHWAAYFGKLACLKYLQVSGMNCDCTTIRLNQSPAHIAAQSAHSECLHWLLEFAAVGIDRQLACLRKLTMAGVDGNGCSSRFHQAPVHLAAHGGQPHVLQWLLQAGACLDTQDYMGETAVHKAARCGSIECASLLVAHGAQLHICNNGGLTPARLAASCGQVECEHFLQTAFTHKQHTLVNGTTPQPGNIGVVMETATRSCDQNGDCEMEVSDSINGGATGYVCDVTLARDISASLVRVAGRKRGWDCGGVAECKRLRRADPSPFSVAVNGFQNGFQNGLHCGGDGLDIGMQNGMAVKDTPRVENGMNGTKGSAWKVGPGGDTLTTSAIEHEDSVLLELGYDALCCNVMLSTYHGS